MPNKQLEYLKAFKSALQTYKKENDIIDFRLIQRMYEYTNNLDSLTNEQLNQLDTFIAENMVSIEHLANVYLDENGKANFKNRLVRMLPIQVTKPQCRIKFIKGTEKSLIKAINPENKVKVLCKTRKQIKAA